MREKIVRGKRILLVDDEDLVRASFSMMLEIDAHEVTQATGGAEALEVFGPGRFDLVITDWKMPGMRGDELTAKIKEIFSSQPVLMVTAHDPELRPASSPGMILNKPFTLKDLRAAIARLLT